MITEQDVKKLEAVFATKQEFNELRGEVIETRKDLANLEGKVDGLVEQVSQLPTKDDLLNIIERAAGLATLRVEHERIKQILREHLKVAI